MVTFCRMVIVVVFASPFETSLDKIDVRVYDGLAESRLTSFQSKGKELLINYRKEWKGITIRV